MEMGKKTLWVLFYVLFLAVEILFPRVEVKGTLQTRRPIGGNKYRGGWKAKDEGRRKTKRDMTRTRHQLAIITTSDVYLR